MQQVIFTGSDAHMPSPYLDAAPRRPIQQGGDMRGRAAALRKFLFEQYLNFDLESVTFLLCLYFIFSNIESTSDRL